MGKARLPGMIAKFGAAAFLWAVGSVYAQTSVGGNVSTDTVWQLSQSPIIVSSDVSITGGATLSVEPGVTVYVSPAANLTVASGSLRAVGSAQAPIRITALSAKDGGSGKPGDWGKFSFESGTKAATLEHVVVEYGSGLAVHGASPTFNYVAIKNESGPAMALDLAASPSGVGNTASGNQVDAIVVPAGDIGGTVTWGLRGIPYLLASGTLSVGASPQFSSVSPAVLEQGSTATFTVTGSRLAGATSAESASSGVSAAIASGGSATQAILSVSASQAAGLGPVDLRLLVDAGQLSIPKAFSIIPPQPYISGVTPNLLYVGQGPTTIGISGKNFSSTSDVLINGIAASATVVARDQIQISVPNQTSAGTLVLKARVADSLNAGQYFVSNAYSLPVQTPQIAVSPANGRMLIGASKTFSIAIPFAAPAGGYAVSVSFGSSSVVTTPASVTIPQGASTASFDASAIGQGSTTLTVARSGATGIQIPITVVPQQSVNVLPSLIMATPNGSSAATLKLGYADVVDYQFDLSTDDPAIATVSPARVTIAAGQANMPISLSGTSVGNTKLRVSSSSGLSGTWPVYVNDEITGTLVVDGPALSLSLTTGQKARLTFSGSAKQLLGVMVGSLTTVPSASGITVYVDRADGTTIGTCPFTGGDVCHLNALPAGEIYTLRVMPNSLMTANLNIQLVTEVSGIPTSGAMGPVMARSVGIIKGTQVQAAGAIQPVVSTPIGIVKGADVMAAGGSEAVVSSPVRVVRGTYGESNAAGSVSPIYVTSPVGVLRGSYQEGTAAASVGPVVVGRPIKIKK